MDTTSVMKSQVKHSLDPVLHLIKEELKSRKFFNVLRTVGLDDAFYQADFYSLILEQFELNDDLNETLDFYYALFEKYSVSVEANEESLTNAARNVYAELVQEKKRRGRL